MESLVNEEKTKELLTEILIEMMQSKRELFYEIVLEAFLWFISFFDKHSGQNYLI
jgi:hypothetical protein